MIDYKFYDTSSLLIAQGDSNFIKQIKDKKAKPIVLSSITLKEIENIKNSNRSADVKYAARNLIRLIDENPWRFDIRFYKEKMLEPILLADLPINDDMKILATAIDFDHKYHPDEVIFISNDLLLKYTANLFFGDECIDSYNENF